VTELQIIFSVAYNAGTQLEVNYHTQRTNAETDGTQKYRLLLSGIYPEMFVKVTTD
jgi:hypothetical protein